MNKTLSNLKVPTPKGTPLNKDALTSQSQRDIKTTSKIVSNVAKIKNPDEKIERITFYAPRGQRQQLPALVGEFREVLSPVHYTVADEFPNFAEFNQPKKQIKDFRNTQSIDTPSYIPRNAIANKIKVWEKINELKNSLTKYMTISDDVTHPTRGDIKKVINCIQLLNE